MSKTMTFQLPDEVYDAIVQAAADSGEPVEEVGLAWLAKQPPKPSPALNEEETSVAWARLRRHAGAVDSGDAHSADNDRVDVDLARESVMTHQDSD